MLKTKEEATKKRYEELLNDFKKNPNDSFITGYLVGYLGALFLEKCITNEEYNKEHKLLDEILEGE